MELRHLRYFVAVAEELNFTRASERLYIAQPPLSLNIKNLEEELGTQLFLRSNHRVALTEAGRVFLDQARHILLLAEQSKMAVRRAARGEIGQIAIGFIGTASRSALPPLIRGFRNARPGVELVLHDMSTAQQIEAIESGSIQLGIVRDPPRRAMIESKLLHREGFCLALPAVHPLAQQSHVTLQEVSDEALVICLPSVTPAVYDAILTICRGAEITPDIRYMIGDIRSVLDLVASGLGVAIIPECVRQVRLEDIVYYKIDTPKTTDISVIYRAGQSSPLIEAFLALVPGEARPFLALVG